MIIAERLRANSEVKKPAVPKVDEKPIMGLKSDKNFITSNAVDVILMAPKKKPSTTTQFINKEISKVKSQIEENDKEMNLLKKQIKDSLKER